MFSKSIIQFFSAVCIVQNYTSDSTEEISTVDKNNCPQDDVPDRWQEKFNKYDRNGDGFINAEELQKLLFKEFNGFVTVRHANGYIFSSTINESKQIGFEHFKNMEPLIAILSTKENPEDNNEVDGEEAISQEDLSREHSEDNDKVDGEETISKNEFMISLWDDFQGKLFEEDIEIFEILDLIGHSENNPIELNKFKKIEEMMKASVELNKIFKIFCLLDKGKHSILAAEEIVVLLEILCPSMATVENATATMNPHDKNSDGKIDFPEFSNLMRNPGNGNRSFVNMLSTLRITRTQFNTYFCRLHGQLPTDQELDQIDPFRENSIAAEVLINVEEVDDYELYCDQSQE